MGRARGSGAVQEMKVGPSQPPVRRVAANHHMLCWLKTVVVSEVEKAHVMRQVGTRKTVRSPSLEGSPLTCRYEIGGVKTGTDSSGPGGVWRVPASWPDGVRHEGDVSLVCCFCTERGKAHPDTTARGRCEGASQAGGTRKGLSTDAGALADRPVVAEMPLLGAVGVGSEGVGSSVAGSFGQPGAGSGGA